MSKKVYTYTKIDELSKAPFFAEIATIPEITMSLDIARSFEYKMRLFKGNVCGFSIFMRRLFPSWNNASQRFTYITILNHLLRIKIADSKTKGERDWLFGCKKNLHFAISNIIKLEEAGVRPEDIEINNIENDRSILLFIEMWREVESKNPLISDFRRRVKDLHDKTYFDEEVSKIFNFYGHKKIIFNGFQYFTPIQHLIYDCFENAGYDIYALIQCEKRYPYANEIWETMYTEEKGFPNSESWIRQEDLIKKNPLGEIFESGDKVCAPGVKLIAYKDTIDFIYDIKRIKDEGYSIYSADDQSINSMLRDYFPERYEARNLLAYPVGQFIYALHKMWDETKQCICLNEDSLRKCFASGWLSHEGKSSSKYTVALEKFLPYFAGCYTLDQWKERLDYFSECRANAYSILSEKKTGVEYIDKRRRAIGNPLSMFSYFSIDDVNIDGVISIIINLIGMAKQLFGANAPISIQDHMNKLDSLLCMNNDISEDLYIEEKKKVRLIFKALESDNIKDFMCYPGDLAQAMIGFLDGNLDDDEQNTLGTLVFNLYQVEGAQEKVHICCSDINTLPGENKKYTWPLNEELLIRLYNNVENSYVKDIIDNSRIVALTNRNYIYCALKNNDVEISWIKQAAGKKLAPSPYITLLDNLSDTKITEYKGRNITFKQVSDSEPKEKHNNNFSIKQNMDKRFVDDEMEYALCPMRYVYSYVLGNGTVYRNEYQINRVLTRFIQILHKALCNKYTIEDVARQVFELFPSIRRAEKRQILDDAIKNKLPLNEGEFTEFESMVYTNLRLGMLFPSQKIYDRSIKLFSELMNTDNRSGIFYDRGDALSRQCELCPHESYCNKSLFGIDYKEK